MDIEAQLYTCRMTRVRAGVRMRRWYEAFVNLAIGQDDLGRDP
jgi:hypothetical protein